MNVPDEKPQFLWVQQRAALSALFLSPDRKRDIAEGRSLRVLVYPWGFFVIDGSHERSVRWSDVRSISHHVTRHVGIDSYTEYHYPVELADGRAYDLRESLRQNAADRSQATSLTAAPGTVTPVTLEQLGRLLEAGVARDQLSGFRERLNAGQAISFGPLTVTPAGVAGGRRIVEWDSIKEIRTKNGTVYILKRGGGMGVYAHVRKIPNYAVFDALVRAIMAERQPC